MTPFEEFPADEKPCTPATNAPVNADACTPGSPVPDSNVPACNPFPNEYPSWVSHQCYTAHCPEGYIGEPVTRCADATSQISQADADAKALAAAQLDAETSLDCSLVELAQDEATLDLSISGLNDLLHAGIDYANLALSISGAYAIPPNEDSATLDLDLTGVNELIPFEELLPLTLTISPLSEYRLETLFDFNTLNLDVLGSYDEPIIFAPDVAENKTLTLTLTGEYNETITTETVTEDKELDLSLTGVYALIVKTPPDEANECTLNLGFDAEYKFRVRVLPERQFSMTLGLGISGTYT